MPTLNWIGKEAVVNHHQQVPFHLLKDVPELACGNPGEGNLIVRGDNLVALKALLPYYAGQVKCIYIDPPYNTGNESWVYNDNVSSPVIREWLGKVVGKEGETLDRHDRWLCMMYPRLVLLKRFLREDGVIFVSIDDNEVASLRLLMDEIFGAGNFLAHITVKANPRGRQAQSGIAIVHDHLLVFAKSLQNVQLDGFPVDVAYSAQFKNKDVDGKPWRELGLRQRGAESRREDRPDMFFPVYVNPKSGEVSLEKTVDFPEEVLPRKSDNSDGRWSWNSAKVARDNHLVYGRTVKRNGGLAFDIFYRDYLERDNGRTIKAPTIFDYPDINTEQGGLAVKEILGEKVFAYPKPVGLIQRVLQIGSDKNSLILDSFGGSGTTAHAILKQNAEDGGNRRFILVEMDDHIARNVTTERVRRVAEGYTNAKGEHVEGIGGGFRYCELGEPLFDEHGKIRDSVRFADLARHVYFTETGEPYPLPNPPPQAGEGTNEKSYIRSSPLLGECRGVGIYLLYNGILGDKSANGGNVLTRAVLAQLPPFEGPKVIYCAGCLLGRDRLRAENIIVRQTPYEIKVS